MAALFVALPSLVAGCGDTLKGDDGVGAVKMSLDIAPGITVATVSYSVTGPNNFSKSGTVDVSKSTTISGIISPIPAGSPYNLSLNATATDGTTMCAGSASGIAVNPGKTTNATVHLTCHAQPHNGGIQVNGNLNVCPLLDGIQALPAETSVGGVISLSASASDPDNAPMPLSYLWSASSGTLSSTTAPAPTLTCTAAGSVTVTLTVSDGDATTGCPATLSATVTCSP
jgi:hypothetical protein